MGKISRKQLFSVAGLIILTAFLIFFFKTRNLNLLVQDQKSSIISFYTANLRSLFEKSPITKEDVLNFALYKELPLDKNNDQYIHLGTRNGENYFEFHKYSDARGSNSYNNFVSRLKLSPRQKYEMDSLLDVYKSEIQNKILVNDKNTIALNSNLWQMNEALLADLYMFTSDINSKVLANVIPAIPAVSRMEIPRIISNAKASADSNFIFVTPDSIFVMPYKMDMKKLQKEMEQAQKDMAKAQKEVAVNIDFQKNIHKWNKFNKDKFKFNFDSKHFRVEIPPIPAIPNVQIPNMDSLNEVINKAIHKIRVTTSSRPGSAASGDNYYYNDSDENNSDENEKDTDEEDTSNYELNINLPDIPALIKNGMQMAGDSLSAVDWDEIGEKIDSAVKEAGAGHKIELDHLKKELKKLKKNRVEHKY